MSNLLPKIIIIFFLPLFSFGQKWEIGIQLGPSNYQGDLAQDITFNETHVAGGIFLKKNPSQYFSHCFSLMQGEISGSDNNFNSQKIRNLSFQTNITELSYQLEFNFFPFSFGLKHEDFTPYVFTGLSLFYFNPKTIYKGQIFELNKLDTEGKVAGNSEKRTYSLYQLAIPIGGGLKFSISDKIIVGINVGFRTAFTDYLDDVSTTYYDKALLSEKNSKISAELSDRSDEVSTQSIGYNGKQRGRSDLNDWYIFSGIFISYKIRNALCYQF
jgi:hypothetical protein